MVRLYSAGTYLDLGEFSTTLTFSIADIREPDKRNASFSKTLTLPGTKSNNLFFENMFEVDVVTQTFNPNLKAKTVLSIDGVTQFKGALKLRKVNYLLGGEVSYDCNLIGNLSDFIQTLGNSKLRDLDLSAYDHTFNQTNIEAAWTPTLGTGYCYPMIDYGQGSLLNEWNVGSFRPAPFVKTVWDAIFSEAGFTYSSSFLASDLYKRLIVPNSNDALRLTTTQVNTRLFNAGRTTAQTFTDTNSGLGTPIYTTTTAVINNDSSGSYFDNDGTFDTANYWHLPNYTGTNNYVFTCDVELTITKNAGSSGIGYDWGGNVIAVIMRENSGVTTELNSFSLDLTGVAASASGTYTLSGSIECVVENLVVGTSDKIYVVFKHSFVALFDTVLTSNQWSLTNFSFHNSVANNVVNIGDTIVLSNSLPDMLQKDFVMGLVKMFNLYIEPDKDDETLLNIEPRNTYYNSTQIDWTNKLDTSKDLEIEPMALLNFKRLICNYKPDEDYYNKAYKSEYNEVYGTYTSNIDNDFVQGDYKIETTFAPTPLVGNFENDRIIPTIFTGDGNPPEIKPITGIARILYWGGLKNCETWDFRFFTQHNYKTQYPYAGHLDDPEAPTIDLSFGVPKKVYYGVNQFISSLTYTDNNLYNAYYSQMISEITDRDSKMVTAYLWLNPVDILNLDFRKLYRIGSHALRLNKVIDYNPVNAAITKCEFIKVKDVDTFVSNSEIMNGGIDIVINSREDAPVIDMSSFQDGNVVARPSTTVILGIDNYVTTGRGVSVVGEKNRVHGRSSSGVVIVGENNIVQDAVRNIEVHGFKNTVGFGTTSVFVHGSGNTIQPKLFNVGLFNTNDQTITQSDVTYINGIKQSYQTAIIYSNSKNLNSSPQDIITGQSGKIIIIREIYFFLDAGGTPFNFASDLQIRYKTSGNIIQSISTSIINSATDYLYQAIPSGIKLSSGQTIQLYAPADAAAGNGLYYYQLKYDVVDTFF